ncbi:MAG: ABC transporter ATP-binding protein [Ruminococcus sp.]|nr:ABC transporter ATP-binding protein [Ruminococcus sp.]
MNILEISELRKSFGDKTVLDGLTLNVPEHSIYGFIGRSGAGKTTTMKIVLGLLRSDSGEVRVAEEKVSFGETATNRFIGYLPDVPEFYGFMTAAEYLRFCGEITGMQGDDIKTRSAELLEAVGLKNEKHRIKGYSRGMKQRLGIAQALLGRPKLLICDEPTSALDPVGRKEILDILQNAREQTTVLFSTHILSDIDKICTDAAILEGGKICLSGGISDLRSKMSSEGYELELSRPEEAAIIAEAFGCETEGCRIVFSEKQHSIGDLMRSLADRSIRPVHLTRLERTLDELFAEVIGK